MIMIFEVDGFSNLKLSFFFIDYFYNCILKTFHKYYILKNSQSVESKELVLKDNCYRRLYIGLPSKSDRKKD